MRRRRHRQYGRISAVVVVTASLGFAASGGARAQQQAISLQTDDAVEIRAVLAAPAPGGSSRPAVVFIHQGGSSKEEWLDTALFGDVVREGWVALAYDIRGHGESGGEVDFDTFFDDPDEAPRDLRAVLDHLLTLEQVDAERIAVVGASIGSNLACVAAGSAGFPVKTAVAISGKTSAVFNLAGGRDRLTELRSVFHIASELEQSGRRAEWATELYSLTAVPRRLEIVGDASSHGVSIFADDPALQSRILSWLRATL